MTGSLMVESLHLLHVHPQGAPSFHSFGRRAAAVAGKLHLTDHEIAEGASGFLHWVGVLVKPGVADQTTNLPGFPGVVETARIAVFAVVAQRLVLPQQRAKRRGVNGIADDGPLVAVIPEGNADARQRSKVPQKLLQLLAVDGHASHGIPP